tara:strand:+ start:163 stop:411 length:249 start_codon:yes stop_codon:yes gene_type:complete
LIPQLIKIGSIIKRDIDGNIIHKIPLASAFTLSMLFVSIYNNIIDKTDTMGIDAINPPIILSFFAISETSTIIAEDINTFIK